MAPSKLFLLLALLVACRSAPAEEASAPALEASVKPGINERFLAPDADVDEWVRIFETESREIAAARAAIVEALERVEGAQIVDVGAGTGLFLEPLARAVGERGRVWAVDIAPRFVAHLNERVLAEELPQVEVVLCSAKSIDLPKGSIDLAFMCDTYHHLEYPESVLRSIRRALRLNGALVVVDFQRIPGRSRDWVFDHVRCGKEQVIREIEQAGFVLEGEIPVGGLQENFLLRFRRP
jgi:SAM-dependent methyltransferase